MANSAGLNDEEIKAVLSGWDKWAYEVAPHYYLNERPEDEEIIRLYQLMQTCLSHASCRNE